MWLLYCVCAGVAAWVALDVGTKIRADRKSVGRSAAHDQAAATAQSMGNPYSTPPRDERNDER